MHQFRSRSGIGGGCVGLCIGDRAQRHDLSLIERIDFSQGDQVYVVVYGQQLLDRLLAPAHLSGDRSHTGRAGLTLPDPSGSSSRARGGRSRTRAPGPPLLQGTAHRRSRTAHALYRPPDPNTGLMLVLVVKGVGMGAGGAEKKTPTLPLTGAGQ